MITDDILKDISGALSKKIKKDFTKYKEYSILFLACDAHVRFARVAQWWSTSLPRRGSRLRIPVSRFYFLRGIQWIPLLLFCSHDVYRTRAGSMSRLPARSLLLTSSEVSTGHPQPVSRFW